MSGDLFKLKLHHPHCYVAQDRDTTTAGTPSLSAMASAAVKRLQRNTEKGFFLMVEGARIDHAHHENYAWRSLEEAVQGGRENTT